MPSANVIVVFDPRVHLSALSKDGTRVLVTRVRCGARRTSRVFVEHHIDGVTCLECLRARIREMAIEMKAAADR